MALKTTVFIRFMIRQQRIARAPSHHRQPHGAVSDERGVVHRRPTRRISSSTSPMSAAETPVGAGDDGRDPGANEGVCRRLPGDVIGVGVTRR